MADMALSSARIHAGVWEGILTSKGTIAPEIEVTHLAEPVSGVEVTALPDGKGQYIVRVPIPAELLSDGVQTFLVQDRSSGESLDSFVIVAGHPLEADLRAEMDLLRAELDMLKRAFRRHCHDIAEE
ncbi:hypothetical protein [Aliiroseovarius sp. F20344]|uniref:hypothetical protein n=1 Tax=Aliiroseovarius sp. F20344 TaxID=2926414 RepID=UPI001FF57B51|nr:hypothetical protein [Aliiroseovarius sp. F20344]MCK0143981.1 hypothetical protein [Aliiroseovarius sp. F20344]